MPKVTLYFSDGEQVRFDVRPDQPILEAAYAAGLRLAKDCEMGDCQTCRATLRSGETRFDALAYVTLDDDEIAAGAILTCVSMAETDVEIELPYLRASLIQPKSMRMTIDDIERLADTTVALRGTIAAPSQLTFHPGQYVNIAVPGNAVVRSYSMANGPADRNALEFLVRLLPRGAMSDYLRNGARRGEALEINGPHGVFYLRDGGGPVLMVAGGTGLAPMLSMLRHMVETGRTERPVTLCFGVNTEQDLVYLDELETLGSALDRFDLRMSVAEPGTSRTACRGLVTDLLEPGDAAADVQTYLCGPPAMVEAARSWFANEGVDRARVFAEEFTPSGG